MDALSILFDIQKRLGELDTKMTAEIGKLNTKMVGLEQTMVGYCTQTSKHEREIYGNGRKGLKDIVSEIRLRVSIYSALGGLVGSTITVFCLEFFIKKMLSGKP